jgi:serine/threonine-protein kinase
VIGTRLAHYEITAHLGSGGMGEVYQATDTKLGRSVAIKLLPAAFASDPDRLTRFQREAQALAALNHLNIAQIYGIEESGGTSCIVMELVEGETLQARLLSGPIAVREALAIAKQIAEALAAAHDKGVIHRDLKPGNIMLADGNVKVLDFGLAKAYDNPSSSSNLSLSPTMVSMAATSAGVILGTAAYMSPEQAKGRAVDRRTDIFAFGCVLYEMLTAKKAFDGEDVTDILGAVLRVEPDWNQLPGDLPPGVHRLLRLCLEKNPRNRKSDATDIRLDLDHLLNEPAPAALAPIAISKRSLWARAIPIASALVIGAIVSGAAIWNLRPDAPAGAVTRFAVTIPQGQTFSNTGRKFVAVSPDGSAMVYIANQRVFHRQLSELDARPIPGTETFQAVVNPVFSPDGRSLAFWAASDRTLKRIAVSGGAAVTLAPTEPPFGISWDEDGIVFGQGTAGISRVSANGGKPAVLVKVKDNESAYGPQVLPGGKAILYTVRNGALSDWDKAKVFVQSLEPGSVGQLLIDGAREARFVYTGQIVYAYQGTMFAVAFDIKQLKVIGGPTPVVEGVRNSGATTGASQFSLADNGTLIFVPGPLTGGGSGAQRTLAYRDRTGNELERLKVPSRAYSFPRVSPDGKSVAVSTDDDKPDIWIIDLSGTSAPRQLTLGGNSQFPVWSHDGSRVAYRSSRDGDDSIFWQKADGTGIAERLTKAEAGSFHAPGSWSSDGKHLAYTVVRNGSAPAVWILTLDDKKSTLFADQAAQPSFSPDGRWLAYQASDAVRQIFVQPFPATGAKYPVVQGGQAFWSHDGSELFDNPAASQIGVVRINTKPTFSFGEPLIFSTAGLQSKNPAGNPRVWDVAPDHKRLIGVIDAAETANSGEAALQINVVLNWFTDLRAKVPNVP